MKKADVLLKSIDLITGDREEDYGDIAKNFQDIADLWSVVMGFQVEPWQVAACMSQVKLARAIKTPEHLDSWVDMGGYVGIGAHLATEFPTAAPIVQVAPQVGDFIMGDQYDDLPVGATVWLLDEPFPGGRYFWTKFRTGWQDHRGDNVRQLTTEPRRLRSLPL